MKNSLQIIILALLTSLLVSAQDEDDAPPTYTPLHITLGKMNALMLDDVRLILREDGDLVGTTRTTRNGRTLYGATGNYEGLARSGVNNWLLYNAQHQLTGTAHSTNITIQVESSADSPSPFSVFKQAETATNATAVVGAFIIMDIAGAPTGTIQREDTTIRYFDPQGVLMGRGEKRKDGTLILKPVE